jgi:hypothetical protein
LKSIDIRHARSNDSKKLLMKGSNIAAAMATFLQTVHEIIQVGVVSMYCLDAM